MNAATHQSPGLWRHPRNTSSDFNRLSYWTGLARLLERGRFDALFIADVLGVYDVYQGSHDAALRGGVQVPVNDPLLIVPAMAGSPSTWASASPSASPMSTRTRSPGACRPSIT